MRKLALIGLVALVLTATAVAVASTRQGPRMGPSAKIVRPAFHGYYDGHKDTYLSTDVSNKAQATQMHINAAHTLASVPSSATPSMYLVTGKSSAAGQLAVFGSEPGESDYSPLWREVDVSWKAGVKPVLLVRDDQITSLAAKGRLTLRHTKIVLNCPIVKVGR